MKNWNLKLLQFHLPTENICQTTTGKPNFSAVMQSMSRHVLLLPRAATEQSWMGLSPNLLASINREVPHGQVLGPVLFSIMVNDITPVYPERNVLVKYADDLTLSVPVSADQDHSSIEVNSVENWAVKNHIKLNLKQTWETLQYVAGFLNPSTFGTRGGLNKKAG